MEHAPQSRPRDRKKSKTKHAKVEEGAVTEAELAERRRQKERRRARKAKQHLAELGLDEHGNPLDNYSLLTYPVRECKFTVPFLGTEPIALNPVVTMIGVGFIWGIVVWSIVDPKGSVDTLIAWRSNIALSFGWLFQGSKALLLFFLMYTMYRFGHIRLGRHAKDKPEFATPTWLAMIFSAGTGPGLLAYSALEPLFHQTSNYYAQAGYRSQDEIDAFAINLTVSNWSILTFLVCTIVAVCSSLAVHCFGLPLTFRSCFYPILGAYTWGWMGDAIDGLAIVTTILVVCNMMYLGSSQIVTGFLYMGWIDPDSTVDEMASMQQVTVWVITVISTASVISGLNYGIKFISLVATSFGLLWVFLVFILDDTSFLLNLQVQEIGYFLQNSIVQLNFWTDAFGQLRPGEGRAIDENSADHTWMTTWVVFYEGFTLALSAAFGLFAARISRGRKLWELVMACFVLPSLTLMIWFCTTGGTALRQSRQGLELEALGETYFDNPGHFLHDGSESCFDVPQDDVEINGTTIFTNYLPGVTPICKFRAEEAGSFIFHVLYSFSFPDKFGGVELGPPLSLLYLACCALFHVAISDSTSLIVDIIASNGRKNNHWARRMFWACSVGALTTAILSSGSGGNSLRAVEAAVVVGALPAVFLLCLMFQSITLLCRAADKIGNSSVAVTSGEYIEDDIAYEFPQQPVFSMPVYGGVLNAVENGLSLGKLNAARVDLGMECPTRAHVIEFAKGLVVPFVSLSQVLAVTYPANVRTNLATVTFYTTCYAAWIVLYLISFTRPGLAGLATTAFAVAGLTLGLIRSGFRSTYNIRSNHVADLLAGIFLWPQVVSQMRLYDHGVWTKQQTDKGFEEDKGGKLVHEYYEDEDEDKDGDGYADIVVPEHNKRHSEVDELSA